MGLIIRVKLINITGLIFSMRLRCRSQITQLKNKKDTDPRHKPDSVSDIIHSALSPDKSP